MRLKLYRAATMSAAMALMRRELGPDALLLSNRKVAEGVEITAALEDSAPNSPEPDRAWISCLSYHGVPIALAKRLADGPLSHALSLALNFMALPISPGNRPLMFIGPPGAGKTLTVARLATRLMIKGIRPFVITADDKRTGAVEQLAAFTRLLGLDLVVVNGPAEMPRALTHRRDDAPVLIDLPGMNVFNSMDCREMSSFAENSNARVGLVLPAGIDPGEAGEMAVAFGTIGAEFLVATRLDVSRRIGCILSAAYTGLALAEAGVGDGAADGLVPMTSDLLARRLLEVPKQ